MRLLIDDLVLTARPRLLDVVSRTHPDWEVGCFDAHGSARSVTDRFRRFEPHVLLVHSTWLHVAAPLLPKYLEMSDCQDARTVVAAVPLDNVTKLQAAHNGFFDVADLRDSDQHLTMHLGEVGRGVSRLTADTMWATIPRPAPLPSMSHVAEDNTDGSILELIRIGLTDNDIAESLYLSPQTVRNRVSGMLRRAGLSNRTQMAWAHTNHLLTARMLGNLDWRS